MVGMEVFRDKQGSRSDDTTEAQEGNAEDSEVQGEEEGSVIEQKDTEAELNSSETNPNETETAESTWNGTEFDVLIWVDHTWKMAFPVALEYQERSPLKYCQMK